MKCWCGALLQSYVTKEKFCPIHKENYIHRPIKEFKEPKKRIPKYSGLSKSENKFNDYK